MFVRHDTHVLMLAADLQRQSNRMYLADLKHDGLPKDYDSVGAMICFIDRNESSKFGSSVLPVEGIKMSDRLIGWLKVQYGTFSSKD